MPDEPRQSEAELEAQREQESYKMIQDTLRRMGLDSGDNE